VSNIFEIEADILAIFNKSTALPFWYSKEIIYFSSRSIPDHKEYH
jgi:hypothetical protein